MQTNQDELDDKRDFFRIQDQLVVEYRRIAGPAMGDSAFGQCSPVLDVLSDLHLLDYESQHMLRQIAERDRTLAGYLKILNKRIDLLGRAVAMQLGDSMGETVAVTLSEGGMSFPCKEQLAVDTWLALRLILLPSAVSMVLSARVVRCQPEDPAAWMIGVSFETLSEPQRQLLARHILQRQAQDIRAQKTQERTPS